MTTADIPSASVALGSLRALLGALRRVYITVRLLRKALRPFLFVSFLPQPTRHSATTFHYIRLSCSS